MKRRTTQEGRLVDGDKLAPGLRSKMSYIQLQKARKSRKRKRNGQQNLCLNQTNSSLTKSGDKKTRENSILSYSYMHVRQQQIIKMHLDIKMKIK